MWQIKNDLLFTSTKRSNICKMLWIFVFCQNTGRNIDQNISKYLSSEYSQELLHYAKQSATDAIKSDSKKEIQKTAETIGDLIGNKIADKIARASKNWPQNNSKTNEEEVIRERFIPSELRHKIINDLRLKTENCWWSKINIII